MLKAFAVFLSAIARPLQLILGSTLGMLVYSLFPRARLTGRMNLVRALPHLKNPNRILRQSFRHFGQALLECFLLPVHRCRFSSYVKYRNETLYRETVREGKGAILLSAHMGNWEYVGSLCRFAGPVHGLFRQQKKLQSTILKLRECTGMKPLDVKQSLKEAVRALRKGHVCGIVGDQFRESEHSFFGYPTHFPSGAYRLAVQTQCPIILALCIRKGHDLVVEVLEVLRPDPSLPREEAISDLQKKYIQWLESTILQYPEQYLWMRDFWDLYRIHSGKDIKPVDTCPDTPLNDTR